MGVETAACLIKTSTAFHGKSSKSAAIPAPTTIIKMITVSIIHNIVNGRKIGNYRSKTQSDVLLHRVYPDYGQRHRAAAINGRVWFHGPGFPGLRLLPPAANLPASASYPPIPDAGARLCCKILPLFRELFCRILRFIFVLFRSCQ